MKLRPAANPAPTSCVRCDMAFTKESGQVRALCSRCDYQLQEVHYISEYVLYGATYYQCSPEGTSHQWLCNNGYMKDIHLPPVPELRGITLWNTEPIDVRKEFGGLNLQTTDPRNYQLPQPQKPPWTIDEAFARTMRDGRRLVANFHANNRVKQQAKEARIIEGKSSAQATWAERDGYPTLRYQPPQKRVGGHVQEAPA